MSAHGAATRLDPPRARSVVTLTRAPWMTLLIALLATGTALVPGAGGAMQYDREFIAAGDLWRIATCHLVHFTADHLGWCLLATIVLGAIGETLNRRLMITALVTSMLIIPTALYELAPALETYRGLSGVASSLFVVLLIDLMRRHYHETNWIALSCTAALGVAFLAKILLEMLFGVTIFVENEGRPFDPVPLAHLSGVVAAILSIALVHLTPKHAG